MCILTDINSSPGSGAGCLREASWPSLEELSLYWIHLRLDDASFGPEAAVRNVVAREWSNQGIHCSESLYQESLTLLKQIRKTVRRDKLLTTINPLSQTNR